MTKKNKLSAYILLDRSGSMTGARWETAVSAINNYVDTLKSEKTNAEVTVAAFDSNPYMIAPNKYGKDVTSFDIIRDKISIGKFKNILPTETSPRGGTPLYDATAQLIAMAELKNNLKTVIIIMTDGEENSSTEHNLSAIKNKISGCTARGWEVLFLGAEFNADNLAKDYGLGANKVINTSIKNMQDTMTFFGTASANYSAVSDSVIDTTAAKQNLS